MRPHQATVEVPQIGLSMVAAPRPGLTPNALLKRLRDAGNEPIQQDGDEFLVAEGLFKPDAAEGELVWACDFCGGYDERRDVIERHELTCERRP